MDDIPLILDRLMDVVRQRKADMPDDSYTAGLFAGGVDRIGRKIVEEAAELVAAAGEPGPPGREHLVHEAADLLYHLLVMLAHRDVDLDDVRGELARRFGISGLEEKASRGQIANRRTVDPTNRHGWKREEKRE